MLEKKKIFILDDNEELLEIMRYLLARDYSVMCSAETDNIVEEITGFGPDLLLLDHSVGHMNSADIMAKLRSNKSFAGPVVLFSAHPRLSDMAMVIGADGYIDKPSDIKHIRNYISSILDRTNPI